MLEIQDHGRIREIRLNRPPVNALNPELIDALNGALAILYWLGAIAR